MGSFARFRHAARSALRRDIQGVVPVRQAYTLEAKETAELCGDFLINKEFEIMNAFVQIYEGFIREAALKRPYFWLLERTYDFSHHG